jgi:hypothetical protein
MFLGNSQGLPNWACPVRKFLGIYCPGCGSTRALSELSGGNLIEMFHQNALLSLSPILVFFGFWAKKSGVSPNRAYILFLLFLVLLFTVIRNLPNSPFAPV